MGGIRILFCDVGLRAHQKIFISQSSYEAAERSLCLHKATLPCLFRKGGIYTSFSNVDPQTGNLEQLSILIRSSQTGAVGHRFLSLTHRFSIGLTTALILGDGALNARSANVGYNLQLDAILSVLRSTSGLWNHPLLLPSIILLVHADAFDRRCLSIDEGLGKLEASIGVTAAGGNNASKQWEDWPASIDVKEATVQIHALATRVVYFAGVTKWQQRCVKFLSDLDVKVEQEECRKGRRRSGLQEVQDLLQYLSSASEGLDRFIWAMQQRIQMQINILYSATSQKDNLVALKYSQIAQRQNAISLKSNELNTRIATSTKKDSIAMMTFTFITALFLPGSYISSLFSMSMFDWQPDSSSNGHSEVVTRQFWVYWAITAPLTAAVMFGWFVWYRTTDLAWQKETGLALGDLSKPDTEA